LLQKTNRTEEEIFDDLASLCTKPGFVHVIAYLCFRDNTIKFSDTVQAENMLYQFSMDRLIRTEISSLIGLAVKTELDIAVPEPDLMQSMAEETDVLLKELHASMIGGLFSSLDPEKIKEEDFNPFTNALALREAIFYGCESAYGFQYRDLICKKYSNDDEWFLKKKGYSIFDIPCIVKAISEIQDKKITTTIYDLKNKHSDEWSILPAFILIPQEIKEITQIEIDRITTFLDTFSVIASGCNKQFKTASDFNITNAYPIIKLNENEYLLFQLYSLLEACYETPFYWFNEDTSYVDIAMAHRGEFTEKFSEERLEVVFGEKNLFTNIDIVDAKGNVAGEIDVLVIFADRAIIVQTKSKKLTLSARKGNDYCLNDDFKKAVQESYNQGYLCAELLTNGNYSLRDSSSNNLTIRRDHKEIYIFCVVSDHYPALSFQSRQFLEYTKQDHILPPFVMDVFLLDVMTEMLQSPLQFLNYINRRVLYGDKILASHEDVVLSYHLKKNLWFSDEYDGIQLGDDISVDLDIAMMVRRDGIEGNPTPDGILTRFKDTAFGDLMAQIEYQENPATIQLGFMLLMLSEDTAYKISDGIQEIARLARKDGQCHDLTVGIGEGSTGLTIHCNNDPLEEAKSGLKQHAELRKYSQKAKGWFGINIDPNNMQLRFGLILNYEWKHSDAMEKVVCGMPNPQALSIMELK